MANKTVPKKFRMGYELRINRTGEKGGKNWVRVGNLFTSKDQALSYCRHHHKGVASFSIMGIYVAALTKFRENFMFQVERKDDKKKVGTHGGPA